MKTIKNFLALMCCSCALWSGGAVAQTIDQPAINSSVLMNGLGQTFTATLTGEVTAISVSPIFGSSSTLNLYPGAAGSGTVGLVGTPAYSQPVALVATPFVGPLQRIDLATPFPVVAGAQYSFAFTGSNELRSSTLDPYAGGNAFSEFATPDATSDFTFQIFEALVAPPTGNTSAIPSSSDWSLMGASLLVLATALFHRRRFAARQRRRQ